MKLLEVKVAIVSLFILAGCATNPEQFGQSMDNAVNNTHSAAVATVSIGTEILHAIIALAPAVLDVLGLWTN